MTPLARPTATARTLTRAQTFARTAPPILQSDLRSSAPLQTDYQPNPYGDYGRYFTSEGSILINYKGVDTRLRYTLWRWLAWLSFTGFEAWYLRAHVPEITDGIKVAAALICAILNVIIVAKHVAIMRRIEIRPDCMILDGAEVFWTRSMVSLPSFEAKEDHSLTLTGIYGTRLVEYLSLPRFDENDRAPDVLATHVGDAMKQLWSGAA